MYAICDANSFYCSCEIAFRPDLANTPVAVLSNNDGCIIARSPAVKALGVPMGAPYHEVKGLLRKHGATVFSSNYALYGDMSQRIMDVLAQFSDRVEVYSIDEAFLDLSGDAKPGWVARDICETVRRWTGIPVSVGVAPTKTLSKVANHVAKHDMAAAGVCVLASPAEWWPVLDGLEVGEVWGVGRRWAARLAEQGLQTAGDLARAEQGALRRQYGVVLARTATELRGVEAIPFELAPPARQQIVVSRSFGQAVEDLDGLREAVIAFVSRAGGKMRSQGLRCRVLQIFARTSPFRTSEPQYGRGITLQLPMATQDTRRLAAAAVSGLRRIYRPGYPYRKAGVMLLDLTEKESQGVFDFQANAGGALMEALDSVNARFGRGALRLAGQGRRPRSRMHSSAKSPSYTTQWTDLRVVR